MNALRNLIEQHLSHHHVTSVSTITKQPLNAELASVVLDCCLTWLPEPDEVVQLSAPRDVDGIIGFAFGTRFEPHGNRSAGPVNEKLSRLLIDYYEALLPVSSALHVWVQWEIGHYIPASTIPAERITKLEPTPNIERDAVAYVSTIDVMRQVCATLERIGKKEGATLLVVAQPDHLRRCMKVVRNFKHEAMAIHHHVPESPDWYDPQSGQLWTRTRHLYLLHDMIGQLNAHREAKNLEAKATGIW